MAGAGRGDRRSTTSSSSTSATVEPSLAGPRRPQDRVPLPATRASFEAVYPGILSPGWRPGRPGRRPQRLGRHRRHHVLHEHLQPDRHGRRRAPRAERRRARAARRSPTVKTSLAPGSKAVTALPRARPASPSRSRRSASRSPATAARPASATPGRSTRRSPGRSRTTSSWRRPSCRATATSRAASTRSPGPATSPRRRSSSPSPWPGGSTSTSRASRSASATTGGRSSWPTSGRRPRRSGRRSPARSTPELFRATYASVFEGDERWRALPVPDGDRYAWDDELDLRREPAVLRRDGPRAGAGRRHRRRPRPGLARRLGHDRPHLAGRLDPGLVARRPVAPGARRRAPRLQLVRRPARPPRGDDARHVRQHPAPQPPRRGQGGAVHPAPARRARRRSSTTPRWRYAGGGRAAARPRRPGVRLRLVARLGGQGDAAARRPGGDRRELRADPPLEPRRDGRPAAPVPAGRERGVARADRPRGLLDRRPRRGTGAESASRGRGGRRRGRRRRASGASSVDCRLDGPIEVDYYRQGGILPAVLRRLARESGAA